MRSREAEWPLKLVPTCPREPCCASAAAGETKQRTTTHKLPFPTTAKLQKQDPYMGKSPTAVFRSMFKKHTHSF